MMFRAIAQPGSASVWGAGGHRFKSCWPDHNKINDLADKLLILFGYILLPVRTLSDFAPKIIREKRLKNFQKSIKVSSKCLVNFSQGLQVMTYCVASYFLKNVL